MLKLGQARPALRRVLALDAGSRCLKLLLAETEFGRLHIRKEELIDLEAEGLVSAEELKAHLQTVLHEWGHPPLALVVPQHLSISQVIDLPLAPESEVRKLIEDETIKLSGLSETRIVYDFVRTDAPGKNRQQFWVTLSQEGHIRDCIQRLGVEKEDLCEVTTTGNALIASFRATCPQSARAILVHLGAQSTVIVVLLAGQGAFAATFQMGSDFLTRSLARVSRTAETAAEALKREKDLLNGRDASAEFAGVVDGWAAELKRQLNEWFDARPALVGEAGSFEMIACGGGFEQPGLIEYVNRSAGLRLQAWPRSGPRDGAYPSKRFHIAYGTALQALGYSAQPVSLLPDDYRVAWQKRLVLQRFEFGSLALAAACALLLAVGTWHKLSLIAHKEAMRAKVTAAQDTVQENDQLTGELVTEYEGLRPLFAAQQNTLDTLKTLALLQESRSNRSFWYVLVADQQTYFTRPVLVTTNKAASTNQVIAPLGPPRPAPGESLTLSALATNTVPPKPGLIAELCIPEDPEFTRRLLSQLVSDLQRQRLFAKVDLLSDDLRRSLADPKVVLPPDRDFVLALDFAETDFQLPLKAKKPVAASPPRTGPKRGPRPTGPTSEDGEGLNPNPQ
jgi:Tfp pilus assembly PilM family ATPase